MTTNNFNRIILALVASMAANASAADLKLSSSDVEQGRRYLEQTRAYVIGATKGLSEAQWKFKPAPDRWSIAEVTEHIILTQEFMLGPVKEQLAKTPAASNPDAKAVDAVVMGKFPDRSTKFQAPEMLQPKGQLTLAEAVARLNRNCDRLIDYLQTTPDLRQHTIEALPVKALSNGAYSTMDGYEWILAAAAHTERHTKQILEVRADPAFPAR